MEAGRARVLVLFGLSGAAGLIDQVIWVRQLALTFGSSVRAAALVTALFMVGLGVGSWLAGTLADARFVRRPGWPLRAYAVSELLIGLLSLAAALVLPKLGPTFGAFASTVQGDDGWYRLSFASDLARALIATVLLLPITMLMGGTLTLLIRHRARALGASAGRDVAALYGINTLGAALGCLGTDVWFVPAAGLFMTQLLAIGLNVISSFGAWTLPAPVASGESSPEPASSSMDRTVVVMSAVLASTGFVSMGLELLWFRHLSSLLGSRRFVFSVLLALILASLWAGTQLARWLLSRGIRPASAYAVLQTLFVVTTVVGLVSIGATDLIEADRLLREVTPVADVWTWRLTGLRLTLGPMVAMVVAPSIAMGASFPLANAAAQQSFAVVGRRAGTLYLFNSLGGAAGSLLVGLVLLPLIGLHRSATVLTAMSCASAAALLWMNGPSWRRVWLTIPAVAACIAFGALPSNTLWQRTIPHRLASERVLAAVEGVNETIIVSESADGSRRLITNGYSMSATTAGPQRYMRLFAHLPLLAMERPERGLVICFGVGNTVHAASLHGLKQLELVDLSEDIVKLAGLFSETHHDVLKAPGVRVHINDGRQHLRMAGENQYDFVTAEPPPLRNAGVSALYSVEFYREVERALKPGGWFTHWLPIYQLTEPTARSVVATFLSVFPDGVLLSGDRQELILVAVKGSPVRLDLAAVQRRLLERPAVAQDLRRVEAGTIVELFGTFAGGPKTLTAATRGAVLVTDDQPVMEYETASFAPRRRIPRELFSADEFDAFCPACRSLTTMNAYLSVLQAGYASDDFLEPIAPPDAALKAERRWFSVPKGPAVEAAIAESPYLQRLLSP